MPRDPKKLWHRTQGRLRRGAAAAVTSTKRQTQTQKKLVYQASNLETFERQPGRQVELKMDAEINIQEGPEAVQVSQEGPEAESQKLTRRLVPLDTWVSAI